MNTSPVTQWDGAEAYFTFADSSLGISVCLVASIVIVAAAIWYGTRHESRDFKKYLKTH